MAHRSKQDKPCPNSDCGFRTLNRQARIHKSQLAEIAEVDPIVVERLIEEDAHICSSCGCVYVQGSHRKEKIIRGFHDDPREDAGTDYAVWWAVTD
jgi:hypothetical protein